MATFIRKAMKNVDLFCKRSNQQNLSTKTRKDLKPPETSWNQSCYSFFILKISFSQVRFGPKNWSYPNWLNFGTRVHLYILISNLIFTFSKSLSFIFSWAIWSQNLKFSKLTKIWYRGTLLHCYHNFNVYFSKIFVIRIFSGLIWSQNLKSSKLTEFA